LYTSTQVTIPVGVGLCVLMVVVLLLSRNDSPACGLCAGKESPTAANSEKTK
jgi:hypothetical protein